MLWSAFVIGVVGSLHCIGMCGPIVLVLPGSASERVSFFISRFLYNIGRAFTYAFLGVIVGFVGQGIAVAGYQQWLGIIAGSLMILAALLPSKAARSILPTKQYDKVLSILKMRLAGMLQQTSHTSLFSIGLLNGFLPCGLVYMALAGSLVMGHPAAGAFYMFIFGLGTLPVMLIISYASGWITGELRRRINRFIPIGIVLLGMLFILRGLSLGIPFLSPDMDKMKKRGDVDPQSIESTVAPGCCSGGE